jgi:hypothetical protein
MTSVYVELPLYSDPSYQYNAPVENQSRRFKFNWNDRTATWQMDVYNEDGTPILIGQRLVAQYPMFVDYDLSVYGLTGYFMLIQKNANQLGRDNSLITDIPERYSLFYIYEEAE